jgi:hypothetical protein
MNPASRLSAFFTDGCGKKGPAGRQKKKYLQTVYLDHCK